MDIAATVVVGLVAVAGMVLISFAWWLAQKKNEKLMDELRSLVKQYETLQVQANHLIRGNRDAMKELIDVVRVFNSKI
mgnify:CR=1 FL=1|jgi:hypothetical protein